ncbi:hypothetical protein HIV01_003485 [Lysobacter arenosi]|uniref:Phage holin family protein n=1 Tax=Lysobacter arenosi TaxID=2795387 RepID=A0ABX7RBT2_9GAMM|nr:hypothetical protein [Lysobacter arenosi]QSX75607.1 hypothetical protein HIV01_003485 [Lysobacter arenosi]
MSGGLKYPQRRLDVDKVHRNTSQEIVEITVDKLRLILSAHIKKSEKLNEWQAALGVLISLIATLCTTTFRDTFGVRADVWKALFIVACVLSTVWLIKGVIRLFRQEGIEQLLCKIKNEQTLP